VADAVFEQINGLERALEGSELLTSYLAVPPRPICGTPRENLSPTKRSARDPVGVRQRSGRGPMGVQGGLTRPTAV
jgi:hypothetical protein